MAPENTANNEKMDIDVKAVIRIRFFLLDFSIETVDSNFGYYRDLAIWQNRYSLGSPTAIALQRYLHYMEDSGKFNIRRNKESVTKKDWPQDNQIKYFVNFALCPFELPRLLRMRECDHKGIARETTREIKCLPQGVYCGIFITRLERERY